MATGEGNFAFCFIKAASPYSREQGYCVTLQYFPSSSAALSIILLMLAILCQRSYYYNLKSYKHSGTLVCRSCSDLTSKFSLKFPTLNRQKPSLVSGVKGLKELRVKLILTTLDAAVDTFVRPTRKFWINSSRCQICSLDLMELL